MSETVTLTDEELHQIGRLLDERLDQRLAPLLERLRALDDRSLALLHLIEAVSPNA